MGIKKCAVTGQVTWSKLSMKECGSDYIDMKCMLKDIMEDLLEKEGVREYIVGVASIMELCAAEIALELKTQYPDLILKYIEAYDLQGYTCYKSTILIKRYLRIVEKCDEHITLQQRYTADSEERQKGYLAKHSDMVLGIWRRFVLRKNSIASIALDNGVPVYCINQASGEITLIHKADSTIIKNKGIIIGETIKEE